MKKVSTFLVALFLCTTIFGNSSPSNPELKAGFVENKGQIKNQFNESNHAVRYLFDSRTGMNVQLRDNGLSYDTYREVDGSIHVHRLDMVLIGATPSPTLKASKAIPGYSNHFIDGIPIAENVQTFEKVMYENVYDGINFVVSLTESAQMKYDFEIDHAYQAEQILLQYKGFDSFKLENNELKFTLSGVELIESIPASWTQKDGKLIDASYFVKSQTEGEVIIGVEIDKNVNPETAILIDPIAILEWGTYYGNEFEDIGNGIATDSLGNIFACGTTHSIEGFASDGSFQSVFSGGTTDAYLVKFNQHGLRHWATYYGGSGEDEGLDVDVDAYENVYLVGKTNSQDSIGTYGIHQSTAGGGMDGFIAKFDRYGSIVWDSYLGGMGDDEATSCHADFLGNIAVVGHTDTGGFLANDSVSPIAPFQAGVDAYLAIFDANGALTKSRFIGGTGVDKIHGVEQDSLQNFILVGSTTSMDNMTAGNPYQASYGGNQDAFIMKIDTNNAVVWSTYFGGDSLDIATGVESVGDTIFLSGYSASLISLPDTLENQDSLGGNLDAFVLSILPNGEINWFTYLGAENNDIANGISRDYAGDIYIIGTTMSDSIMGTPESHKAYGQGEKDVFVVKYNAIGEKQWSTYYGGAENDLGNDIAVYGFTSVYVTGLTESVYGLAQIGPEEGIHQSLISQDFQDAFLGRFTQTISTPCVGIGGGGGGYYSGSGGGNGGSNGPPPIGICIGDSIKLNTHGGALGEGAQWVWYENDCGGTDNFIGEGSEIWVSPDTTTWYFVRAESVDCITHCAKVQVHVDYPNTVTAWAEDSVCAGENIQLFAEGGYSFLWEGPNDSLHFDQNPILDSVSMAYAGVYQVIGYTQFGCSDTTEIDVEVIPGPVFSSVVKPADCPGAATGSILLTTTNDSLVFEWISLGSDSTFVNNLSAGNYSVLATNEYGCTLISTISVGEEAFSIDSLKHEAAWCDQANGSAHIFVTSDSSFEVEWIPGGQSGSIVSNLLPGQQQAIVTNNNQCTDSVVFTVQNLGEFTTVIEPDSMFLPFLAAEEISAYTVPTLENISYNWWPESAISCSTCPNPILDPDTSMYFYVEITSDMGCNATDSIYVERDLPISVAFVPTLFSPNADGLNDELCVLGTRMVSFELKIYSSSGQEVFSTNSEEKCWDGNIDGVAQTGTFIYTLNAILEEQPPLTETGNITIKR